MTALPSFALNNAVEGHKSLERGRERERQKADMDYLCYSRDKSGAHLYLNYTGVLDITPELGAVLSGSPDAKTTDFGNSCEFVLLGTSPSWCPGIEAQLPWLCAC